MAILRSLMLALLLAGGMAAFPAGASSMPAEFGTSSYNGPDGLNPALYALERQPLWRAPLDGTGAAVSSDLIFFLSGGQLTAARLATGEVLWRYGNNVNGPVAYAANLVLLAETGQLVALDGRTGQEEWRRDLQLQRITQSMAHGSLLLVVGERNDAAVLLDVATGSERYRYDLPGIAWPVLLTDTVLYLVESFGEPSFRYVSAHDVSAGKELWRASSTGGPIWREDGRVYLHIDRRMLPTPDMPVPAQIKVLAEHSGELLDTWSYATDSQGTAQVREVFMTADEVIMIGHSGSTIHHFPWGGADEPDSTSELRGQYRVGLRQGVLLSETSEHALYATRLQDSAAFQFLQHGSPVSRIDLISDHACVGRIDGLFQMIQLMDGRQRFFVRTGAAGFGPTLRSGAYLILQTPTELLVVEGIQ